MKNATRKFALVLVALVMVLSLVLTACQTKHDYTVKVVGPDGKPYTAALVQPCLVDETAPSGLGTCYAGVPTDDNGVAYFDIGKEIMLEDDDVDEIEVHLLNLPSNLTYQQVRMHKGETATITVTDTGVGSNLKTPKSGSGTGSYVGSTNQIDVENFDPYVVVEGSYPLVFDSADQKIYYAFEAFEPGMYKVYSSGDIDASVIQLMGSNQMLYRWAGEGYENDNISDDDFNFCYEFEVEQGAIDGGLYMYFEVALEFQFDVGIEAVITFEYVGESQGDDIIHVNPANTPVEYTTIGTYVNAPIDGSAEYVLGSDGNYHLGTANGPVLVATLGTDSSVNSKHKGNNVAPRGFDIGFTQIYLQAGLTIYIDGIGYDYYPLVAAYTAASNSEGRYPVTDELIEFLNGYLVNQYGLAWFEENSGIKLPKENPWLVWCGYYENPYTEEVTGGGDEADGSDEDNAIMLEAGRISLNASAGEAVYYTYHSMSDATLIIRPYVNLELAVYSQLQGSDGAQTLEMTEGSDSLMRYEINIDAQVVYYLVFTIDADAEAPYDIFVEVVSADMEEGTEENPKEITFFGEFADEIDNISDGVYYSYTVASDVTKLYFTWDSNTNITVIYNGAYISSSDPDDVAKLTAGLSVESGDVITIIVNAVKPGTTTFTISDSSIAD